MPEIMFNFIMSDTLYDRVDTLDKSTTRFRQSLDNSFRCADADVLADPVIQTLYERVCKTFTHMERYSLHWKRVLSDAKTLYRWGEEEIKTRADALDKSFIFRTGMGAKSDVFYSKLSAFSATSVETVVSGMDLMELSELTGFKIFPEQISAVLHATYLPLSSLRPFKLLEHSVVLVDSKREEESPLTSIISDTLDTLLKPATGEPETENPTRFMPDVLVTPLNGAEIVSAVELPALAKNGGIVMGDTSTPIYKPPGFTIPEAPYWEGYQADVVPMLNIAGTLSENLLPPALCAGLVTAAVGSAAALVIGKFTMNSGGAAGNKAALGCGVNVKTVRTPAMPHADIDNTAVREWTDWLEITPFTVLSDMTAREIEAPDVPRELLRSILPFAASLGAMVWLTPVYHAEKTIHFEIISETTSVMPTPAKLETKPLSAFAVVKATPPLITVPPQYLTAIEPWFLLEGTDKLPWQYSSGLLDVTDLIAKYAKKPRSDTPFIRLEEWSAIAGQSVILPEVKLFDIYKLMPLTAIDDERDKEHFDTVRASVHAPKQWLLIQQETAAEVLWKACISSNTLQKPESLRRAIDDALSARLGTELDFISIEAYIRTLFDAVLELYFTYLVTGQIGGYSVVTDTARYIMQKHFVDTYSLTDVVRVPGRAFGDILPTLPAESLAVYSANVKDVLEFPEPVVSVVQATTQLQAQTVEDAWITDVCTVNCTELHALSEITKEEPVFVAGVSAVKADKKEKDETEEETNALLQTESVPEIGKAMPSPAHILYSAHFDLHKFRNPQTNAHKVSIDTINGRMGGDKTTTSDLESIKKSKGNSVITTSGETDDLPITPAQQPEQSIEAVPKSTWPKTMVLVTAAALSRLVTSFTIKKTAKDIQAFSNSYPPDSLQALLMNAVADVLSTADSILGDMTLLSTGAQIVFEASEITSQFLVLCTPIVVDASAEFASEKLMGR